MDSKYLPQTHNVLRLLPAHSGVSALGRDLTASHCSIATLANSNCTRVFLETLLLFGQNMQWKPAGVCANALSTHTRPCMRYITTTLPAQGHASSRTPSFNRLSPWFFLSIAEASFRGFGTIFTMTGKKPRNKKEKKSCSSARLFADLNNVTAQASQDAGEKVLVGEKVLARMQKRPEAAITKS